VYPTSCRRSVVAGISIGHSHNWVTVVSLSSQHRGLGRVKRAWKRVGSRHTDKVLLLLDVVVGGGGEEEEGKDDEDTVSCTVLVTHVVAVGISA